MATMQTNSGRAESRDLRQAHQATVDELSRVVTHAESLLTALGDEGGEAVSALRERVTRTMQQAQARLESSRQRVQETASTVARRADEYVHENPWRAVAIGVAAGAAAAVLMAISSRRGG